MCRGILGEEGEWFVIRQERREFRGTRGFSFFSDVLTLTLDPLGVSTSSSHCRHHQRDSVKDFEYRELERRPDSLVRRGTILMII